MEKLSSIIMISFYIVLCLTAVNTFVAMEQPLQKDHSTTPAQFDSDKEVVQFIMTLQSKLLTTDASSIESVPQEFITSYNQMVSSYYTLIKEAINKLSPLALEKLKDRIFDDLAVTLEYQVSAESLANRIAITGFVQLHKAMDLAITKQKITELLNSASNHESLMFTLSTKYSESLLLASLLRDQGCKEDARRLESDTHMLSNFEQKNIELLNNFITQASAIQLMQGTHEDEQQLSSSLFVVLNRVPQDIKILGQRLLDSSESQYNRLLESNPETAPYAGSAFQ